MAWWDIEHRCGHSSRVQIYGPHRDRPRKAEWHKRDMCEDCAREWREAEISRYIEEAKVAALPQLTGTHKQVAWAIQIRGERMGQLTENGSKMLPRRMSDEARKEIVRLLAVTSTDARFWIDTRTIELQSFVRRLVWLHSNTNGAIDGPGLSLVDNRLKLTDPEDEALYQIAEAA